MLDSVAERRTRMFWGAIEIMLEAEPDAGAEGGEGFTEGVWEENGSKDVACSPTYLWQLLGMRFDLIDITVFFPKGAISDESCEA